VRTLTLLATGFMLMDAAPALAQTGTLSGTVGLEGPAPAAKMLVVTKNKEVCGETVRSRNIVVTGGKLEYAVVSVEGLKGTVKPRSVLLSNTKCTFQPSYMGAGAGDTIVVDNQDALLHNTHLALQLGARVRTMGNWGLSDKGSSIRAEGPLRLPGNLDVTCDAHPWMTAHITVFDHPYFATSDQAGRFEIKDVPAGTYTVKVRHQVLGEREKTVTVKAGTTTNVAFAYP
jgi:plastocyanin